MCTLRWRIGVEDVIDFQLTSINGMPALDKELDATAQLIGRLRKGYVVLKDSLALIKSLYGIPQASETCDVEMEKVMPAVV